MTHYEIATLKTVIFGAGKAAAGLEAWLGAALVDRSTFPTRLTEAGEAFKGPAADLINRLHAARALVRGHQTAAGDALVFAVPHTCMFIYLLIN